MNLQPKLTLAFLFLTLIPLAATSGLTLWFSLEMQKDANEGTGDLKDTAVDAADNLTATAEEGQAELTQTAEEGQTNLTETAQGELDELTRIAIENATAALVAQAESSFANQTRDNTRRISTLLEDHSAVLQLAEGVLDEDISRINENNAYLWNEAVDTANLHIEVLDVTDNTDGAYSLAFVPTKQVDVVSFNGSDDGTYNLTIFLPDLGLTQSFEFAASGNNAVEIAGDLITQLNAISAFFVGPSGFPVVGVPGHQEDVVTIVSATTGAYTVLIGVDTDGDGIEDDLDGDLTPGEGSPTFEDYLQHTFIATGETEQEIRDNLTTLINNNSVLNGTPGLLPIWATAGPGSDDITIANIVDGPVLFTGTSFNGAPDGARIDAVNGAALTFNLTALADGLTLATSVTGPNISVTPAVNHPINDPEIMTYMASGESIQEIRAGIINMINSSLLDLAAYPGAFVPPTPAQDDIIDDVWDESFVASRVIDDGTHITVMQTRAGTPFQSTVVSTPNNGIASAVVANPYEGTDFLRCKHYYAPLVKGAPSGDCYFTFRNGTFPEYDGPAGLAARAILNETLRDMDNIFSLFTSFVMTDSFGTVIGNETPVFQYGTPLVSNEVFALLNILSQESTHPFRALDIFEQDSPTVYFDLNQDDAGVFIGEPLLSEHAQAGEDQRYVMPIAMPVIAKNATFAGGIAGGAFWSDFANVTNEIQIGESGFVFMVNRSGFVMAGPDTNETQLNDPSTNLDWISNIGTAAADIQTYLDAPTVNGTTGEFESAIFRGDWDYDNTGEQEWVFAAHPVDITWDFPNPTTNAVLEAVTQTQRGWTLISASPVAEIEAPARETEAIILARNQNTSAQLDQTAADTSASLDQTSQETSASLAETAERSTENLDAGAENTHDLIYDGRWAMYRFIGVMIVIISVVVILIAIRTGQGMIRPIKELTKAAEDITNGDLGSQIHIDRGDEIGRLSDSFRAMTESLKVLLDEEPGPGTMTSTSAYTSTSGGTTYGDPGPGTTYDSGPGATYDSGPGTHYDTGPGPGGDSGPGAGTQYGP